MKVEISEENLRELHSYNRMMTADNDEGQPFEFWHSVGMLDISDEILKAATEAGWVPPVIEEEDEGEDE